MFRLGTFRLGASRPGERPGFLSAWEAGSGAMRAACGATFVRLQGGIEYIVELAYLASPLGLLQGSYRGVELATVTAVARSI